MPVKKKITRNIERIGENGCVEFFPKIKKSEVNYDCVDGKWVQKMGMPNSCSPKSKFLSDDWNDSYTCYPSTGRYRHIPGTPAVPRKPRKKTVGPRVARVPRGPRGPTAFNVFFSQLIKSPQFKQITDGKERFRLAMATAKEEWRRMTPEIKAQFSPK